MNHRFSARPVDLMGISRCYTASSINAGVGAARTAGHLGIHASRMMTPFHKLQAPNALTLPVRQTALIAAAVAAPHGRPASMQPPHAEGASSAVLVLCFICTAVASRVANRILLVPMERHTLFLALATSIVQFGAYATLLFFKVSRGSATREMLRFAMQQIHLLVAIGICEGGFYPLVFGSAAKLSGGLVQVLNQTVVPYTFCFSVLLLGRRFSRKQLLGVAIVLVGVLVAVGVPTGEASWHTPAASRDVFQCAGAFSLLAWGVTLKDVIFRRWHGTKDLEVALVCACAAAVQLLVQAFGLFFLATTTGLGDRPSLQHCTQYLVEGWQDLCGAGETLAPWIAVVYWGCNVAFSLSALRLVRRASAPTVVLANVAALPISALLFCFPLPLLKPQSFRWTFALSLLLVASGNLIYGLGTPSLRNSSRPRGS
eukprot:TRINITY_DN96011_c0_g1_i1.p1 TRINITY_DN96011_c0_g1~~TRINITY_DN96011_c0_g1_i1.p1  ORF type:complete len:429 (-),score=58.89 TRINITY_DN96011_c0_g1_i1:92-1378(-)